MFCIIRSGDLSCYVNKYMFYMWIWKRKSILGGQGLSFGCPHFVLVGWAKASILNVKSCMFCLSTCKWWCVCLVGLPRVWQIIVFCDSVHANEPSFKL